MVEIKTRNHSIDQLKIVAMFFIILGHFLIFRENGLERALAGLSPIKAAGDYAGLVLLGFAIIGTNLFFLITGYFGSKLKIMKILDLLLVMYLWGGLIQMILLATHQISASTMLHTLLRLPDRYWFMEVYLVLMLATPVMNAFLGRASLNQKRILLGIWFFVLCIYSMLHECSRIGVANGFSFIWAAFLYVTGNVIRETDGQRKKNRRTSTWIIYMVSTLVYIGISVFLTIRGKYETLWKFAVSYNNPLVFAAAVSFFRLFTCRRDIEENKAVSLLSGATLGVYLIHTAPNLNLFSRIALDTGTVHGCLIFIAAAILGSAMIFIVCAMLDQLRQRIISPPVVRMLRRATGKLTVHMDMPE